MSVSSLQAELDGALGAVRSHTDDLKSSVELQQQYERLVHSLQELLALGSERLTQQPDSKLHSRAQLQQQLSSHTVRLTKYRSESSVLYVTKKYHSNHDILFLSLEVLPVPEPAL